MVVQFLDQTQLIFNTMILRIECICNTISLTDTKSNQRGLTLNVDRDTEQVDHSCLEIDEVFFMWSGNLISLKMQLNQIFDRTPNQRQLK